MSKEMTQPSFPVMSEEVSNWFLRIASEIEGEENEVDPDAIQHRVLWRSLHRVQEALVMTMEKAYYDQDDSYVVYQGALEDFFFVKEFYKYVYDHFESCSRMVESRRAMASRKKG